MIVNLENDNEERNETISLKKKVIIQKKKIKNMEMKILKMMKIKIITIKRKVIKNIFQMKIQKYLTTNLKKK